MQADTAAWQRRLIVSHANCVWERAPAVSSLGGGFSTSGGCLSASGGGFGCGALGPQSARLERHDVLLLRTPNCIDGRACPCPSILRTARPQFRDRSSCEKTIRASSSSCPRPCSTVARECWMANSHSEAGMSGTRFLCRSARTHPEPPSRLQSPLWPAARQERGSRRISGRAFQERQLSLAS